MTTQMIEARLPLGQPPSVARLGELCCRILEVFAGSPSEKNALYLAQHLNEIRKMADHNPRAFDLLRCILKSPRVVVVSQVLFYYGVN